MSFPAVNASASTSRVRWRWSHACSFSTRRFRRSTNRSRRRCSICCRSSRRALRSPTSSSRTISTWCSSSATGCMVMYLGKVVEIGPVDAIYSGRATPIPKRSCPRGRRWTRSSAAPNLRSRAIRRARSIRRAAAASARAARWRKRFAPTVEPQLADQGDGAFRRLPRGDALARATARLRREDEPMISAQQPCNRLRSRRLPERLAPLVDVA